jgi:hypothetical protein
MKTFLPLKLFLILIISQISSCGRQPESRMVELKGPEEKKDIVFFYNKNVSHQEQQDFQNNTFYRSTENGYQVILRISSWMRVENSGYIGFSIEFREEATAEHKAEAIRLLKASPLIYRVYENIAPNDIKALDKTAPTK